MNHMLGISSLKNTYVAMRHGRSLANEAGIIVSDPSVGISSYGLSDTGRDQATHAASSAREQGLLDTHTLLLSSDFARARETAEIVADTLGVDPVITTPKLRERFFGTYDGASDSNYESIWETDTEDAAKRSDDVESIEDVEERVSGLIRDLETSHTDRTILLVSHGDTLQVLTQAFAEAGFLKAAQKPFATAEIRELN